MAIDSRDKRASALNSLPTVIAPLPDGAITGQDRQQITWLYRGTEGIEIVVTSITPTERTIVIRSERRTMTIEGEDRRVTIPFERRVI